jgi:predicted adenine nucleotide alpha hydrolase (AANH) superfamily ATPase
MWPGWQVESSQSEVYDQEYCGSLQQDRQPKAPRQRADVQKETIIGRSTEEDTSLRHVT